MVGHVVYGTIVNAVKTGKLKEAFSIPDLIKACPKLNQNTCGVFLYKHRKGNPYGNSELFERISDGKFKLIRPFKYGF